MSDDEPTKTHDQTASDPESGALEPEPRDAETDAIEQSLAQIEALSGTLKDLADAAATDVPDMLGEVVDQGADDGGPNEASSRQDPEVQTTRDDPVELHRQDLADAAATDVPDKLGEVVDQGADDGEPNEANPRQDPEVQATRDDPVELHGTAAVDEAGAFLQTLEADLALEHQTSPPESVPQTADVDDDPDSCESGGSDDVAPPASTTMKEPEVQAAREVDEDASTSAAATPSATDDAPAAPVQRPATTDEVDEVDDSPPATAAVDNIAPVPTAPAPTPALTDSTEEKTVQQVDAAMADEVGELLGGLTDAVDELMRESADPPTAIEAAPVETKDDILWDEPEPNAVQDATRPAARPDDDVASHSSTEAVDEQGADALEPAATKATPDAPKQPEVEPQPEVAGGAPDSPLPNDESEPAESAERSGLWAKIEPPLITILKPMSYPMRFVPSSMRPVVDWIALSLVFWVPIVWVLALFVFGG